MQTVCMPVLWATSYTSLTAFDAGDGQGGESKQADAAPDSNGDAGRGAAAGQQQQSSSGAAGGSAPAGEGTGNGSAPGQGANLPIAPLRLDSGLQVMASPRPHAKQVLASSQRACAQISYPPKICVLLICEMLIPYGKLQL
jgi:hypothetical protein